MGDVTVITGTYGADEWCDLARERAGASVPGDVRWVHVHLPDGQLHEARNAALAEVESRWVIHLDADDELAPGYVDAMRERRQEEDDRLALKGEYRRAGTLFAPMVRYHTLGRATRPPRFPNVAGHRHDCTADCLEHGNWLIVGTMAPAGLVRGVGGWRDFAWSEDWDLWLRCWRVGAVVERVPGATYTAHVRRDSRNRAPDLAFKLACHDQIHRANFPELHEIGAA